MGALSFMGQFVPLVELGLKDPKHPDAKRQSIRNFRKYPLKVGEPVYLYFGMRTKWCKKIGEAVVKSVQVIHIYEDCIKIYANLDADPVNLIYSKRALNRFAKADGFKDWETMKRWWKLTHGPDALPFSGNLYKW